jgi:glycosyltransferase involved in cell wall biosynthesis
MRIAIVHDYLHQFGGAEKVVEKWLEIFPESHLYTSIFTPDKFLHSEIYASAGREGRIRTSYLQRFLPLFEKNFKHFFWLYPLVMSLLKIKDYDVVIYSSTYCGKNVQAVNCGKLIHYCNTPPRFLYNLTTETDHASLNVFYRLLIPFFKPILRRVDMAAVKRLNRGGCRWYGNSEYIQSLIKSIYNTKAGVIYPPIDIKKFSAVSRNPDKENPYYLYFGRISFHKRLDLAIDSCLDLRRKLIIAGESGFEGETIKLKNKVRHFESNNPETKGLVTFAGRVSDEKIGELLSGCKGFIFPGKEDFGIAPVEVLAGGTPLIMYKAGGALEYLQEGVNGVFSPEQTKDGFKKAILDFEKKENWSEEEIRKTADRFSEEKFKKVFKDLVKS